MADVEILASQVEAAPLIYSVPGGQEILLKVASATLDGSAASGPWQPAIQIVGPSGQVLRTFVLSTALPAGAVADVTWFPRVGGGGSSGGTSLETTNTGGTVTVSPTNELLIGSGITLTNPGAGIAELIASGGGGGGGLTATVASYDATVIVDAATPAGPDFGGNLTFGTELFDYSAGNNAPAPLVTGLYLFLCENIYTGAGSPGDFVQTELFWNDPVVLSNLTSDMLWPLLPSGGPPGIGQITSGPSAAMWLTAGQTGGLNFETTSVAAQTIGCKTTVALITGSGGGGSGIMFDTEPQPGTWLDYETTGQDANGYGSTVSNPFGSKYTSGVDAANIGNFTIEAYQDLNSTDGVGQQVSAGYFEAVNAATTSDATSTSIEVVGATSGGDAVGIDVGANVNGAGSSGDAFGITTHAVTIGAGGATGLQGTGTANGTSSPATGGNFQGETTAGGDATGVQATALVTSGGNAYPFRGFVGGVEVFRVESDGTVHVKTGASTSLIADL